jgi:hypothetical protein
MTDVARGIYRGKRCRREDDEGMERGRVMINEMKR